MVFFFHFSSLYHTLRRYFIKSKNQMLFIMLGFLNQININIRPPQPQKLPLNLSNLKKGPVHFSKNTYKKINLW